MEHATHNPTALARGNAAIDLQHSHADFDPPGHFETLAETQTVEESPERLQALEKLRNSAQALKHFTAKISKRGEATDGSSYLDRAQEQMSTETFGRTDQDDEIGVDVDNEYGDGFCLQGKSPSQAVMDFALQIFREPGVFVKHYARFAQSLLSIAQGKQEWKPDRADRRFRDVVWNDNIIYRTLLQSYLCWSEALHDFADELNFNDDKDRKRIKFLINQWAAACSPSNTLLNPVVIKRAYQTGGQSLLAGAKHWLDDVSNNQGMPRQINKKALTVGVDLGLSDGAVVYRCEQFELIQYQCAGHATSVVSEVPVLVVPPQINKYYVFDLTPKNSVVKHLLDSGLQVFIVSWKNPSQSDREWDLSTYVAALNSGVRAIQSITRSQKLSLVSACAGGVTATALQGYYRSLELRGDVAVPQIVSHSLLVTSLSARNHPILDLFANRQAVLNSLARSREQGFMDGRELAHVFAWLRPTELVWNFWVNNYLLGKEPPTMDVLYWDNDSTRLPAGLHRDFVNLFVNDRYACPNSIEVCGQPIDLHQIKTDFYLVGGDEDYLMPWQNCLRNRQLFPNARCDFVLSTGGHIQSILRPPNIANIAYYTNSDTSSISTDNWLHGAEKHQGSWWLHWAEWLRARSGAAKPVPAKLGSEAFPPLVPAPGTYVFEQ